MLHNSKAPKILNEIANALRNSNLIAESDNTEGRVNSKKDEDKIIAFLKADPRFTDRIVEGALRNFSDMNVIDYDGTEHVVNIKTSVGSSDNAFSKLGLLWALTDLTIEDFRKLKIAKKISDKQFSNLVVKHKKDTPRDYWFLSLDKKDFRHVVVRGVKQITNWGKNPTNNLQINWSLEHKSNPGIDKFDDVFYNVITNGAFKCWSDKAAQWMDAIKYRNDNLRN